MRGGSSGYWCGSHSAGTSLLPNDETAISAPMWAFTPLRFAAVWKRAAPYRPFRSASAIAGMPSSTARSMNDSGCDDPARKLNALDAWSSIFVDDASCPITDVYAVAVSHRAHPTAIDCSSGHGRSGSRWFRRGCLWPSRPTLPYPICRWTTSSRLFAMGRTQPALRSDLRRREMTPAFAKWICTRRG